MITNKDIFSTSISVFHFFDNGVSLRLFPIVVEVFKHSAEPIQWDVPCVLV